jgi:hypothetical protein
VTSYSLVVMVSGQPSNAVNITVAPPSLVTLRLYDVTALVRVWRGALVQG